MRIGSTDVASSPPSPGGAISSNSPCDGRKNEGTADVARVEDGDRNVYEYNCAPVMRGRYVTVQTLKGTVPANFILVSEINVFEGKVNSKPLIPCVTS